MKPPLKDTESDDSDDDSDEDSDEEDEESEEEEDVTSTPRSTRSRDSRTDSGYSQVKLCDFIPLSSCAHPFVNTQATFTTFTGRGIKEKLQNGYNRPDLKARSKKGKKKDKREKKTGKGRNNQKKARGRSESRKRDNAMRSKSRSRVASRSESPVVERPTWGFGPSRAASRMEEEYLDGYHSDDSVNQRLVELGENGEAINGFLDAGDRRRSKSRDEPSGPGDPAGFYT